MHVNRFQNLLRGPMDHFKINGAELGFGELPHKKIFGHGQMLREIDVLIDRAESKGLGLNGRSGFF